MYPLKANISTLRFPAQCVCCRSATYDLMVPTVQYLHFAGLIIPFVLHKTQIVSIYLPYCKACSQQRSHKRMLWFFVQFMVMLPLGLFGLVNYAVTHPDFLNLMSGEMMLIILIVGYFVFKFWFKHYERMAFNRIFGPIWTSDYRKKSQDVTVHFRDVALGKAVESVSHRAAAVIPIQAGPTRLAKKPFQAKEPQLISEDVVLPIGKKGGVVWWHVFLMGLGLGIVGQALGESSWQANEFVGLASVILYFGGVAIAFVALIFYIVVNFWRRLTT